MSFICITMKFESAVDEVVTYCTEVCFLGGVNLYTESSLRNA